MARLILVRHGQAAAGWDQAEDPGLSPEGQAQAAALAAALSSAGPLPVVTSPLARTRATAAALEAAWGLTAVVDPRVGEIPSPPGTAPGSRGRWLAGVMQGRWDDDALPEPLRAWRDQLLGALAGITTDTVVVTHFIATNAAVGAATGDTRVVCFRPDYCSRTVVDNEGDRLRLLSLGGQSATVVR